MKIKKGQKLIVHHDRSGTWNGIASADFDTNKDEWYEINLAQESVRGISTTWEEGQSMPARRDFCTVIPVDNFA